MLALAGCGGSGHKAKVPTVGSRLTIYSSLPFLGPERGVALDIVHAEALALSEHDNKVGRFPIRFISRDDATVKRLGWDPGATSAAARRATQDHSTIAYLGEMDSGASAISIPVLNQIGILQISPVSSAIGLTQGGLGADKGEPDKYYPSALRTFGRMMPADNIQASYVAAYMLAKGCTQLYILHDAELYDGDGVAEVVAHDAAVKGIDVLGDDVIPPAGKNQDLTKAQKEVRTAKADCVFFGVVPGDRPAAAINAIHRALPKVKLFTTGALANRAFTRLLRPGTQAVTFMLAPWVPQALQPASAKAFSASFAGVYHHVPAAEALYGYEAMQALLQAISDAGAAGDQRPAVIKAFLALRDRDSPLGMYSINRRGDTTLRTFAGYAVRNGAPVYDPSFTPGS